MRGHAVFRVDADEAIGSGHLVRCRLLADALRGYAVRSTFVTVSTPERLRRALEADGHAVTQLPRQAAVDPAGLAEAAHGERALLVLDGDSAEACDTSWQRAIRARGLRLMIITFRHECRFAADLVLNQNLLALGHEYSSEPSTELLLGPAYAVLADGFRRLHDVPLRPPGEAVRNLLVTFGGADRQGLTIRTVQALARLEHPPQRLVVVAGSLYGRLAELEALLEGHVGAELHVDTQDMPALMAEADLAVTSGGLTAWELACAGVPNVIVSSSEPERQTGALLDREGIARFAGHHDQAGEERISGTVSALIADPQRRHALAVAGRRLVDGRGTDRVVDSMLKFLFAAPHGEGCRNGAGA